VRQVPLFWLSLTEQTGSVLTQAAQSRHH